MKIEFLDFSLEQPYIIHNDIFRDERGYFREIFQSEKYFEYTDKLEFVQTNHSFSWPNVLRGLHTQPGQSKLISVISGKIFDVIVDIRLCSVTYKKWFGIELDQSKQIYVPDGFAHGFLSLESANVVYQVTSIWNPKTEVGIIWNDTNLSINWPIKNPNLSDKDNKNISFNDYEMSIIR
jgi:dTDP-4-dehydrorhamnose 3,5-epimerase